MGWIEDKSAWLDCPYFADVFEGCEALECFEPAPIIVCVDEVVEVRSQQGMAVIMVSFDGSLLGRPVHPFDPGLRRGRIYQWRRAALRQAEPMFVPAVVVTEPTEQAFAPAVAAEFDLPDGGRLRIFASASPALAAASLKALR